MAGVPFCVVFPLTRTLVALLMTARVREIRVAASGGLRDAVGDADRLVDAVDFTDPVDPQPATANSTAAAAAATTNYAWSAPFRIV